MFKGLVGSYHNAMLASKYTTKQAILEVMEQKRVQTNEDALNNMVYFYLFIFNNMVY